MPKSNNSPIYAVFNEFLNSCLTERNLANVIKLVADDIYGLMGEKGKVAPNKQEFCALLKEEFDIFPSSIPFCILDYKEKQVSENIWDCFCNLKIMPDCNTGNHIFLTISFQKIDERYLISMLHMSRGGNLHQEKLGFLPFRFASNQIYKMDQDSQQDLIDIICQMMPGGIIGAYIEPGFPLYVVNDTLLGWLDYSYEEFVIKIDGLASNMFHPDDIPLSTEIMMESLKKGEEYKVEHRVMKKDGSFLWVNNIGRKIVTLDGREAIISVLLDITNMVQIKNKLLEQSETDSLTGLYNRRGGEERIAQGLRTNRSYVFLILDIDNFKCVNDIYGHQIGDEVLKYVAQLLQNSFRMSDVKLRLGGDEFIVFVHPCPDKEMVEKRLEWLIREYEKEIAKICPLSNSSLSFGGVYRVTYAPFTELYQAADKVLYEIKQKGKGSYQIEDQSKDFS